MGYQIKITENRVHLNEVSRDRCPFGSPVDMYPVRTPRLGRAEATHSGKARKPHLRQ